MQVNAGAAGTTVTNTGTFINGLNNGRVQISARIRVISASEGSRRLPHAGIFGDYDITVSTPGKAKISVRKPRPLRPPAPSAKESETQAEGSDTVEFTCYNTVETVPAGGSTVCDGPR